jgi:PmbA protein
METETTMGILSRERALEIARGLVESSTADETEVVIESSADRFVRFAATGPTQSADRERHQVSIRVRIDSDGGKREGAANCDGIDMALINGALERAVDLARHAPPNPDLIPLGGPVDAESRQPDVATLEHGFEPKADWVRTAIEACEREELLPAGLTQTGGYARAVVNSSGRAVYAAQSRASFALTASSPDLVGGAGFADQTAASVAELDPDDVIRRAVLKAVQSRDAEAIDAGEYTVVLEPAAVSAMLLFAGYAGFGCQDVEEKSSFICGRLGERCLSEGLSVVDDASNDFYPSIPFDFEGSPKARVELITEGLIKGMLTDHAWAAKLGVANTGHGRKQPDPGGPTASSLCVRAGDQSLDELIAGVDHGLLITQFHYTNLIDPLELTLTGMTRNGTFLIENGKVTRPVKNLRFTMSMMRAWAQITGVGKDLHVAGALFDGEVVTPALRIDGFRFTSTTAF